jgi:hypothetical protein
MLVFALIGGVAYLLALNGWRVPLLYTQATGLDTAGIAVARKSRSVLLSSSLYSQNGTLVMKAANTVSTASDAPFAYFKNEQKDSAVDTSANRIISESNLVLAVAEDGTRYGTTAFYAYPLAGGTATTATGRLNAFYPGPAGGTTGFLPYDTDIADLKQSILYPLMVQPAATQVLEAVNEEIAYRKTDAGKPASLYRLTIPEDKAAEWLPAQATVKTAELELVVPWGADGVPSKMGLSMRFSYAGQEYTYEWESVPTILNPATPGSHTAGFERALNPPTDTTFTHANLDVLATVFGLSNGSRIPGPAGSATAPPSTPTPPNPITPTGEGVTQAGRVLNEPPVPPAVADGAAKLRDKQRKADLADLQTALAHYKQQTGAYPVAALPVQTISHPGLLAALVPAYLTKMPVDPLKSTYWYEYQSDGSRYLLRSVAEDRTDREARAGLRYWYFEKKSP